MNFFAKILKEGRDINGLTQQSLIDKLESYSDAFSTLNLTTLSRWERGITLPSPKRQSLIARCLNIDEELLITHNRDCADKAASHKSIRDVCERAYHQPYYDLNDSIQAEKLSDSRSAEKHRGAIEHFVHQFLNTEFTIPEAVIRDTFVYTASSQILGHLIIGAIEYRQYQNLKSHSTSLSELTQHMIPISAIEEDKEYSLVVPCSHAMDARATTHMLLYINSILLENRNIRNLLRTCTSRFYFPVYSNELNANIIGVGAPIQSFNGVKWRNKRYSYVLLDIEAAELTSSKEIKYCSGCKIDFNAPITSEILKYQSLLN